MKQGRIEGRVEHSHYVIAGPQGVVKQMSLEDARADTKLAAAIRRNGWEEIPNV